MTTQQTDALQCAANLEYSIARHGMQDAFTLNAYRAMKMVRAQHARITELESQLAQRFDAADVATASAQGFRDGVASVSAGSEPVAWLRNTTDPQPHAVTNLKYRSAVDTDAGIEYIPVFAAPQSTQAQADGFFLLLPQRPKPEAPAGTVGLDWDAYSGAQMLAFGRDSSDAAIAALRTEQPAPSGATEEVENLRKALVYAAFALHDTPQYMLAQGITLIDGDTVRVSRDGWTVEASVNPHRQPAPATQQAVEVSDAMVLAALQVQYPATYGQYLRHPADGPKTSIRTEAEIDTARRMIAAALAAGQATAAQGFRDGVVYAELPDAPLPVFSKGPWTFKETGQSFSGAELDEAAFVAYRDRASHGRAPAQPDPAYSEACSLDTALFKKHFAHLPDFASGQAVWSLCDSTAGVISQIDNMVAGLVQPPTTSPQAAECVPAPVLWLSPEQFANFVDADEAPFGKYVPARKTRAGKFTMPLFAARAPAPAQPVAEQGVAYAELPDEREAFEAMMRSQTFDSLKRLSDGSYESYEARVGWLAWIARASHGQAPAGAVLPAGWVPLTITHEGQYPEEVAYGPQIMMDRLGKWLGKYFAQAAQADSVQEDAARLERERICAAIKAEDDYCVDNGDYMLDSDDCIKIVRGEWVRPAFSADAARKQGATT